MIVYLCHQFGGDPANCTHVENLITALYEKHSDWLIEHEFTPFSPLHATGYLYSAVPYHDGMRMCLEFLKKCDCMMVFKGYSDSRGCLIEQDYCHLQGIPIIYYDDFILDPDGIYKALLTANIVGYTPNASNLSRKFLTGLAQDLKELKEGYVQIGEKTI